MVEFSNKLFEETIEKIIQISKNISNSSLDPNIKIKVEKLIDEIKNANSSKAVDLEESIKMSKVLKEILPEQLNFIFGNKKE